MMAGHEDEQLVSLAISRLLSTLDDLEPGASLPRCCSQSVIVKSLTVILFSTGPHQFFFRELLVSLHCVLGGSLLPSALRLVDKVFVTTRRPFEVFLTASLMRNFADQGAVKMLIGRGSGKKVVQVEVEF